MPLSRRDFIKLAGLSAGAMALRPFSGILRLPAPDFPKADHLGRLTSTLDLRSAPRADYPAIGKVYEDTVVPWLREVNAQSKDTSVANQRWVETDKGFLYGTYVQPVRNLPNETRKAIPQGKPGFWAEVTIPYVDLFMDNPPPRSPWAKDILGQGKNPRLYYSQVVWIDQVKSGDAGQILYRFNEEGGRPAGVTGGSYGDIFWADGRAFRALTQDDVSAISPDVDPKTKKVVVNLTYQTLSCFEGNSEVYFCRCSTGGKWDASGNAVDNWATNPGDHITWRKALSIHMSAGTAITGYDTPAVSWTNLFDGVGIAVHAAFWHNGFGEARSHGCVNVSPEDAKWIFRWTLPQFSLDQADITVPMPGGTHVVVDVRIY
jgi:hypothetical protein